MESSSDASADWLRKRSSSSLAGQRASWAYRSGFDSEGAAGADGRPVSSMGRGRSTPCPQPLSPRGGDAGAMRQAPRKLPPLAPPIGPFFLIQLSNASICGR